MYFVFSLVFSACVASGAENETRPHLDNWDSTTANEPKEYVVEMNRQLAESVCYTANLLDSYGNGWDGGATLSFTSVGSGAVAVSGLTCATGSSYSTSVCFVCGCFFGQATAGSFPNQNTWNVKDSAGGTLTSAAGASKSSNFCIAPNTCPTCAVGSGMNNAGTACELCPGGRFNNAAGISAVCTECGYGKYTSKAGSTKWISVTS